MKIYIGADHRGFTLKQQLKKHLSNHDLEDVGAHSMNPQDDYPEFASKVAKKVASNPKSRGVVICGSGVGADISANKIDDIRAGLGFNEKQIKEARAADNINVLALAADYTQPQLAKELVDVFLATKYQPKPRRQRRLKEIEEIEESEK